MAAQCAICAEPIVKGMKFVLAGTEVFHDRCAAFRGTHTSIGNTRHQHLVDLEAKNAAFWRQQDELQTQLRVLKDKVVKETERLVQRIEDADANTNSWRRRYELTRTDLERTEVERDQARRELAVARQYGLPPASAPATTPEQKPADTRDATEIRFSLLDLD